MGDQDRPLGCPYCDEYSFPDTQDGRHARVCHLYRHHAPPPLSWAQDLKDHDRE